MRLVKYHPGPPLDTFVDCFWWSQRRSALLSHEAMLPSGKVQMIFALHDAPIICLSGPQAQRMQRIGTTEAGRTAWSRGIVHGPQWGYFVSGPKPPGIVAGVSFRAGAAGAILGLPTSELTDRHVPIDALWGTQGTSLHERLFAVADQPAVVFQILEQALTARIRRPLLMHPAIAHALAPRSSGAAPSRVIDVRRESGYSPKHFINLFRAAVGMTPKHYQRVQRFSGVLYHLAVRRGQNLADIAALAGYSDQSHLTREFRDFTGTSPTQYRPRDPDSPFHHQLSMSMLEPPGKNRSRRS